MLNLKQNVIFSVTTALAAAVFEIGLIHDLVEQEYKMFIKRTERSGSTLFEDYSSKTIDVLKNDERVSFFNPYDVPEKLELGDVVCSLTNVQDEAILKANIWGDDFFVKVPNVDAIYF